MLPTLATVNARSLKANLGLRKPIIHDLDIDLLCLTETWPRQEDSISLEHLPLLILPFFTKTDHQKLVVVWRYYVIRALKRN